MRHILQNEHGIIYTSGYVFRGAVTVALARTKQIDFALDVGRFILDSKKIIKLLTSEEDFVGFASFHRHSRVTPSFSMLCIASV